MIMDNTITAHNGTAIYTDEIYSVVDGFISSLEDAEKIKEPQVFTALMNTVYNEIFRPQPKNWDVYEQNRYHSKQRSILNLDDIETLDNIWNVYMSLCVKYEQIPTLLDYSIMTGIQNDTFTDWITGYTRGNDVAHSRTAKRWKETCESALAKRAVMSNSIGSIFALKACHGWRENDPVNADQMIASEPRQTPEQIAERHKNAKRPELPQLDE